MIDIVKKQADRFSFLERVYERADAYTLKYELKGQLAHDLNWDKHKIEPVIQYLFEEKLIDVSGSMIAITHLGIKEIESAKTSPDKSTQHFAPLNLMYVAGSVINSQMQLATSKSSQSLTAESFNKEAILKTLSEIKETIKTFQLRDRY